MATMTEARFWEIVDSSRQAAIQRQRLPAQDILDLHEQALAEYLRQLSPDEIVAFENRFADYHRLAYRWDLWGAAYWLHGGCGDDGFIDFRSCLISLGRELFFQVLKDPDSLADIVGQPNIPYTQSEGFQYVASRVYQEKTGQPIPQAEIDSDGSLEPTGEQFDHDDAEVMRQHFPKLVAKFPDMGD